MSITITGELSSIVNSEIRSSKILQLFRSGSDTPATHSVIYHSIYIYTYIETKYITFFFSKFHACKDTIKYHFTYILCMNKEW